MADAAISATIQVALETVISLAADRVSLVLGFGEELERLRHTAETIRGILADADRKMHIAGVKNWLEQLEGELFKAEDVLDELNYENLRREVKDRNQLKKKVCFFFSHFNTIGSRSRLASKIRDINLNLERINRQANDVGLVFRFQIEAALPAATGATTSRQTDSILVPNVVGRVDDESKIVDMLSSPSEKVLSVIPITGSGGLLVNKEKEEWKSIVKESQTDEDQDEIDQILKVSFDHLSPASVKKCFAYCSIFPQDTELREDELIQHWMAEGFVQPDRQNQRLMEEIGGEYLRILLQSSLLEKVEEPRTYYKLHDLVHDFAKSVLNPKSSSQDRYLALHSYEEMAENGRRNKPASIRSLFLHLEGGISADMNMLSRFKHLHVLKLSGYNAKFLPISIGKLLRLRLLDISSSGITSLPESLCKLYNLQTLTIDDDELEGGFPKRMSDLISLQHLNYDDYHVELKIPVQMGLLTCLQTLEFFNVSQERGRGIEELGTLKYLKGSLEIRNLELVKGKEAANQAKLFEKPDLFSLMFKWESGYRESDNRDEDVLEGLHPHPNLERLEIRYFMGNKFPQWLINLSKLEALHIIGCKRCSELPSLGQLPSLKRLELVRLDNIRFIGDEFYGEAEADVFPMLRNFHIRNCPQLTTLPCSCKSLHVLWIYSCDNLRELPDLDLFGSSLQQLTIARCPRLISLGVNGQKCPLLLGLKELSIDDCEGLTTISDKMFQSCRSLRSLSVERCPNLVSFSLNLQETPSLERFILFESDLSSSGC
ncbi:unnamed protein product [Coffea canephora]|uniref:Uncharacterized protein n=1 Tax=Coffea canephora TaxID=49390 RepID=A0A068UXQ3_COFCA|nr:unnamed protein product [Coffea canephora]